jgi:hypothetical protein
MTYTPLGIVGTKVPTERNFLMCSPAICPTCRKVTYTGCGMHVDQVLAGVPQERRCECG